MTHYKGRQNAKAVERDFPQFVDIVVPLGGLGARLDAMYDFHVSTASNRNAARVNANGSVIRWCFADLAVAKSFATMFAVSE